MVTAVSEYHRAHDMPETSEVSKTVLNINSSTAPINHTCTTWHSETL